jgi:hypothetical protein
MTLVGDGLDECRASRERAALRIVLDMAAQATGTWFLYDDFFEDLHDGLLFLGIDFKDRETHGITRLAALQVIWGSEIASSHGTTARISRQAILAASGFNIPRAKIVRLI